MVKKNPHLLAQSSVDLLLVFGTIIVVLIPLFYYSGQNVDIIRERQIADGLLSVRNAVATLLEIGVKSATREIITNPSGITGYNITQNLLNVYFKNQNVSIDFQLPIFAGSRWPITQGIHRINLYNEGNYIIFTECGNSIVEAYEQCDGTAGGCDFDSGAICSPSGSANECKCSCNPGACPQGYICDPNNICQPNGLCSLGYTWLNGKCCPDLDFDTFYGTNGACPPPIDCDDADPTVGGPVPEVCTNVIDDDCDGFADCADPDCNADPACGGALCGDGNPEYSSEECDDGNVASGDGCSPGCTIEIDLWDMFPNPQWINQPITHFFTNPNIANYIASFAAANGLPTIVKICDEQGYDATTGNCLGSPVCSFDAASGGSACTGVTPAVAGSYNRWLGIWAKQDVRVLNVQLPGSACGNGNLDAGEECEECSLDADCASGMCVNGVCASDPQFGVSNCDMNNPGNAMFSNPLRSAVDSSGNVYVADSGNHRIRKIYPNGMVITIAGSTSGSTDGPASTAKFNLPSDVEWSSTNKLYVVDLLNNRIRVIDLNLPTTDANFVTTLAGSTMGFADGIGSAAKFWSPSGATLDLAGTKLYVADGGNNRIREIDIATQAVTTLAGGHTGGGTCGSMSGLPFCNDGIGNQTEFFGPRGITARPSGGGNFILFVADKNNHRIRRVHPTTAAVTTPVGGFTGAGACNGIPSPTCNDGIGNQVRFYSPEDIAYHGGWIYIADTGNHRIRRFDVATADVVTIAGSSSFNPAPPHTGGYVDGDARTVAQFNAPMGIAGVVGINKL
ncbi:MAG: hypothetical protein AABX72_02575, partial [Nanoarchaeota archaeon]